MNYIFKLFLSYSVEISIILVCSIKLLFEKLYKIVFYQKKEKAILKRNFQDIDLLVFKSGTMGDHLICIDVLDKLSSSDSLINKKIVCKKKSIFKDIYDFASHNNINLLSYQSLLSYFFLNIFKNRVTLIIDTEPNFRIGLLFGLIMPRCFISTNYRATYDNFFSIFDHIVKFNFYDENLQEGLYIKNLINNCINLFLSKNSGNILRTIDDLEFKNKFLSLNNTYIDLRSLEFHEKFLEKIDLKKRKLIYLYYGCSGKAMHRLPSINWMKNLEKLLLEKFYICYVGGPSECKLNKIMGKNEFSSFSFINKFSITDWSIILNYSRYKIPLLSFDGGFSHVFGIHSPMIFQVFCSSNNNKWKNKSDYSFVYSCLEGGSPNYKPYKFKVPEECIISQNAWLNSNEKEVFDKFINWIYTFPNL